LDTVHADPFRHDVKVIGLIGLAHGLSHFFQLALPSMFPLLRAEFDVSFAALGALAGVFYLASGLTQFAAGFAVDRFGARPVLLGGLALLAGGTVVASLAPGILWLYPIAALMGVGNGVFHPADFAILNANVTPRRLGHAYSTHGIGGNLGYALSPVVSYALGSLFGWRPALALFGVVGLIALGLLATQRAALVSHRAADARTHTLRGSIPLFLQPAILLCFGYFVFQTIAGTGLQTLGSLALNVTFEVPLALAASAITAYLLGSTAGILAGGFLAARTTHHDRLAAAGLFAGALLIGIVATGIVGHALLLPLFATIGFVLGGTGPSRDLIVRNATPRGAAGRVYGFVYSGLDTGATIAPIWFGAMLDHGMGRGVFLAIALVLLVAIGTVIRIRTAGRGLPATSA
jgi:FSR family fosmidomycin resistance protein-like MFS transporter